MFKQILSALALSSVFAFCAMAAGPVPEGSKVFIASTGNGFDKYLSAAFEVKKVPLAIVAERFQAEYELEAIAESKNPGWVRIIVLKQTRTDEKASVRLVHIETGAVVFAYSYDMNNAYYGKQSSAESVAKHLKRVLFGK